MADISRDTFKLTNVLHQLMTGETVANPKHYVGVKLQQGVPILDADWNEMDDIRRMEVQALLHLFIGSGVPEKSQGFEISGSDASNDFTINAGIILVDGMIVVNLKTTTYNQQTQKNTLPDLSRPSGGLDRTDLVFIDVWDTEIGAFDGDYDDDRLVNPQIGVETARRLARHWAVRVEEGEQDLENIVKIAGHHYSVLAILKRTADTAAIFDHMIVDQRRRGLTLADHLKVPIYVRRGIEVVDIQRFVNMVNNLRTTLFERLRRNNLKYQTAEPDKQRKESLIQISLQELMHLCQIGENQARAKSLDNVDALSFMFQLYGTQVSWLDILEEFGNDGSEAQEFIDTYRDYLGESETVIGLKSALDKKDLLEAVIAQEKLNAWLGATGDHLPEGNVDALCISAVPYERLQSGRTYNFTYEINSYFASSQASEEFRVEASLNSAFGTVTNIDQSTLIFRPPSGNATITVTIDITGEINHADLDVIVFASRNPLLVRSTQMPIRLEINEFPPVAAFYFYAGPLSPIDRVLEIPQDHLTRSQGSNVRFKLRNDSETETRTYKVEGQIIPDVANTSGWDPLSLTEIYESPITLDPEIATDTDVYVNIKADDPDNVPPVDTGGEIHSTAVLTGSTVNEPQEPIHVTVRFLVVEPR